MWADTRDQPKAKILFGVCQASKSLVRLFSSLRYLLSLIENKGSDVTRYMERISWTCNEGLRLENAWAVLSASINQCRSQDKGQTCKDIAFSLTLKYRQMLACSVYLSDSEVEVTFSLPHVKHN